MYKFGEKRRPNFSGNFGKLLLAIGKNNLHRPRRFIFEHSLAAIISEYNRLSPTVRFIDL